MMLFSKSERVLLISPHIFSIPIITAQMQVKHVDMLEKVFPALYETVPHIIVFNYDSFKEAAPRFLARIRGNRFYDKTKIYGYKTKPEPRTDEYLISLGINFLIYKTEIAEKKEPLQLVNSLRFGDAVN